MCWTFHQCVCRGRIEGWVDLAVVCVLNVAAVWLWCLFCCRIVCKSCLSWKDRRLSWPCRVKHCSNVSVASVLPSHCLPGSSAARCISVLDDAVICACSDGRIHRLTFAVISRFSYVSLTSHYRQILWHVTILFEIGRGVVDELFWSLVRFWLNFQACSASNSAFPYIFLHSVICQSFTKLLVKISTVFGSESSWVWFC